MNAAIFDLDGTLVDSYDAHYLAWREVSASHAVEISVDDYYRHFGRRNEDLLRECWLRAGKGSLSDAQVHALDHEKEAAYRAQVATQFPVMTGASELVRSLRDAGWRLAVGSSGPPLNVQLALDGLGLADCFEVLVTGSDVKRSKPDPECFLLAAERLGVAPKHCVVLEDAPAGIAAAKSAGMACAAITSKGHSPERQAHADLVVDRLDAWTPAVLAELIRAVAARSVS
ncbi:MAG: HAD family phosphatase [Phycisphaerales bacterium]|nr:HAD family phosphatase [Phycisphaerales bacterium]